MAIITFIVLLLQFFLVLYLQRTHFFTNYDFPYWKDRVEHSRYFLPLSNRGIGDDEFYAYAGYKILQGVDPTKLVFDKPALGLSIVGLAESLYNPALSGIIFGIGILLLTYLIIKIHTKHSLPALITVTFLLFDPLFFQGFSTSLLDLPQLFFLLVNILCLQLLTKDKIRRFILIFISGITLGIFAQIKIPVIYPLIVILEVLWLFRLFGITAAALFILGNIFSLIFGYIPYTLHGYSFITFLKIQKYVLSFYKDSQLQVHPGAIWQYLFTGGYADIVNNIYSRVAEWTVVYPIAIIAGIYVSFRVFLKERKDALSLLFAAILLASLIVFTFIPFYTRYIILFLPFLYYFLTKVLIRFKNAYGLVIIVVLFGYSLVNTVLFFYQSPSGYLSYFYSNFSHEYFQDIYQEQIDDGTKMHFSRSAFRQIAQQSFTDAKISNISIQEHPYKYTLFADRLLVPVTVTYKTAYLGNFTENKYIEVVREDSQWKIKWQWDYILTGFTPDAHIISQRDVGKRGTIMTKTGTALIEDTKGYLISINPSLMKSTEEPALLTVLRNMSQLGDPVLQNAYNENPLLDVYIPLFTTQWKLSAKDKDKLLSFNGIKVEDYPSRLYYAPTFNPQMITNTNFQECCTRIYSSYNYHGNAKFPGVESQFDAQLSGYDGGLLEIVNKDNTVKRIIIKKNRKDGKNVVI